MRLAKHILITLTLAAFVLVGACGKKDEDKKGKTDEKTTTEKTAPAKDEAKAPDEKPAAAGDDAAREALAKEMIAFFDKVIDAAKKNQEDCDAMAEDLKKVVAEGKPLMAKAKEMDEKDPGSKEWFEEHYGKAIEDKMTKELMPAMMKCAEHKGVAEAMQGLGE